jgi:hypothetical protein
MAKKYIDAKHLIPDDFENCSVLQAKEIIDSLPTADVVSKSLLEQYKYERDLAIEQLQENGIEFGANEESFNFDYGVVVFKHRFSINRSLNDYEETTLNKCIRIGLELVYKTVAQDKLVYELQIVYKDENENLQCLKKDLENWTFEIKHTGNMQVNI